MAAGISPGEVGVAEYPAHRVTVGDFRRVGGLGGITVVARRKLLLRAEEARPARDGEGDHHALALLERRLGADLDHFAHILMAQYVAGAHPGNVAVV